MHLSLVDTVMVAWVPAVILLFKTLGGRRTTVIAVFVGCLFLPRGRTSFPVFFEPIFFEKKSLTGLGLLLGMLAFDRKAFSRFRPHWVDLLMVVFVLSPLISLAANPSTVATSGPILALFWQYLAGWGICYIAGRLYLGDDDGPRLIARAFVLTSLLYIPICVYETILGPNWFLANVIYGTGTMLGAVYRLGGNRPEGFFSSGIELCTWMAMATVLTYWLVRGCGWRMPGRWGRVLGWVSFVALLLTTLACRGVYGYILLAVGLLTAEFTLAYRTRVFLVALALIPIVYIGVRLSGAWEGKALVELGDRATGRGGTVAYRLTVETLSIEKLSHHNLLLGFGGGDGGVPDPNHKTSRLNLWTDGWWLQTLVPMGLVGLIAHFGFFFYGSVALVLARPSPWSGRHGVTKESWGLALYLLLHALDSLHNAALLLPTMLVAGSFVSLFGSGDKVRRRFEDDREDLGRGGTATLEGKKATPIHLAAATACVLSLVEMWPGPTWVWVKLVGELGHAPLFAAAGAVGALAVTKLSQARLVVFGAAFAILSFSLDLALGAAGRPVPALGLLQGLALCGLIVSGWRRIFGDRPWSDTLLALVPLAIHLMLSPSLKGFPGSGYLFSGPGRDNVTSFFPLCPWLTLAVLGARAVRETATVNLSLAALFATGAGYLALTDPAGTGFTVYPMSLPFLLLAGSVVGATFAMVGPINVSRPAAQATRWLGRHWLTLFYVHFAVAWLLVSSPWQPWAVWSLSVVGALLATWVIAQAAKPLAGWFESPIPWVVLLGVVAALATGLEELPRETFCGLAWLVGLVFSTQVGTLLACVANPRFRAFRPSTGGAAQGSRPSSHDNQGRERVPGNGSGFEWREGALTGAELGRNFGRLVLVLALLASPEIVGAVLRIKDRPPNRAGEGVLPAPGPRTEGRPISPPPNVLPPLVPARS